MKTLIVSNNIGKTYYSSKKGINNNIKNNNILNSITYVSNLDNDLCNILGKSLISFKGIESVKPQEAKQYSIQKTIELEKLMSYYKYDYDFSEKANKLVKAGADPNAKDIYNIGLLYCISMHNDNPNLIQSLVKRGADINEVSYGYYKTPLSHACHYGRMENVKKLLELGADPYITENNDLSRNCFHVAAEEGFDLQKIIDELKAKGKIKPEQYNRKKTEILRKIMESHSGSDYDFDKKDERYFASPEFAKKVKQLVDEGANPNTKCHSGLTALHCMAGFNNDTEVIKSLVEHGANMDARICNNNFTPFIYACFYGKKENIKTLLELGVNPKPIIFHDNRYAFDCAKEYGIDLQKIIDEVNQEKK